MSSSDKESKPAAPPAAAADKELDDLLDSALADFDKPSPNETAKKVLAAMATVAATAESTTDAAEPTPEDAEWNEEFLNQAKFFEEQMAALFGAGGGAPGETPTAEQLNLGFQRMAEAAQLAGAPATGDESSTYVDHFSQALKNLKEGTESLATDDTAANMFAGLQLDDSALGGANPIMPFVQGMMQSLLSAEVLLPSLRELLVKYPDWLAANEGKVEEEDLKRFQQQQELFKVICAELEQERPDDSADVKSQRFQTVLGLMQKLHEYGQPPAEIVGADESMLNAGGMPGFPGMPGMAGLPGLPGMPPQGGADPGQCSIM